ncbi:MAG TPA: AI-2E family transporter, partial [Caldimonas sp.]|nr:AI-2E family transporter [Caldimonas sp.]
MSSPFAPGSDRPDPFSSWVGRSLLFIAVVLLLWQGRTLFVPIAIAIVFTFVLAAPVRALRRAGIHEYLGAAIVIAAVLLAIVVIGMLIAAPAAAWWSRAPLIVHELVESVERWRDAL